MINHASNRTSAALKPETVGAFFGRVDYILFTDKFTKLPNSNNRNDAVMCDCTLQPFVGGYGVMHGTGGLVVKLIETAEQLEGVLCAVSHVVVAVDGKERIP